MPAKVTNWVTYPLDGYGNFVISLWLEGGGFDVSPYHFWYCDWVLQAGKFELTFN